MSTTARPTIYATPGGMGGGNGPFWDAVRRDVFAEHGLDVQVRRVRGGSAALARALADGELHFANFGAAALLAANLNGADLVCVMGLANRLVFQIMTAADITTVDGLRGRTLAASPGSTDAVLWQWFLPRHGLHPGRDVRFRHIADTADQMESLRRGEVDAMTLSPAGSAYLEREGFNTLVDFASQDVDFQLGCVVTSRRVAETYPDETLAYVRAYVAAIRHYKRHRDEALAILRGYTGIEDEAILIRTYDVFARVLQDWPYPNVKGFETVLSALGELDSRAQALSVEQQLDVRWLDELRRADSTPPA